MLPAHRIFVAVDTTGTGQAAALIGALRGAVGGIKLGLEFFVAHGPEGVRAAIGGTGLPLFLDLKLHDIPNTVAGAVRAAVPLAPAFLTVHASGGPAMMRAALDAAGDAAARAGVARPRLLAVTVLTSLDDADLGRVGQAGPAAGQVARLADLAAEVGIDGVVCSPAEVAALRRRHGPGFVLMVPGIRPAGSDAGDQKRVMTPREAVEAGADHLVIGRPITQAADPAAAARAIVGSLS
jgi:orotidine-5'-phosphate decarboxylase